jgi:hypothetical protein
MTPKDLGRRDTGDFQGKRNWMEWHKSQIARPWEMENSL